MEERNGWRARVRAWIADGAARVLEKRDPSASVGEALEAAQKARQLIEDVESATWHLLGLPSRRDVKKVMRRAAMISQRIEELEETIRALEEEESETKARASSGSGRP